MANTQSMPAEPKMETEPAEPSMSVTEAMDVLDEFHIRRGDMQRVYTALETMMEPPEAAEPPETDSEKADGEMMSAVFARNKAA